MTDFTISITDAAKLAGIAAARNQYNADLPEQRDPDTGEVISPKPGIIETDEGYVQFVMDAASASYAQQYGT